MNVTEANNFYEILMSIENGYTGAAVEQLLLCVQSQFKQWTKFVKVWKTCCFQILWINLSETLSLSLCVLLVTLYFSFENSKVQNKYNISQRKYKSYKQKIKLRQRDNIGCELTTTMRQNERFVCSQIEMKFHSTYDHYHCMPCFSFWHRNWIHLALFLVLSSQNVSMSWLYEWLVFFVCECVFVYFFMRASYHDMNSSEACHL